VPVPFTGGLEAGEAVVADIVVVDLVGGRVCCI